MTLPRVGAVIVAAASTAAAVSTVVLGTIAARAHVPGDGSAWIVLAVLCAVIAPVGVGVLLVWRLPTHTVAWILLVGGLSVALATVVQPYAEVALIVHSGALPHGEWAAAISDASWPVFFAWPLALAFVFPDGRLLSGRWRPFAVGALIAIPSLSATIALSEERLGAPFRAFPAPTAAPGLAALRFPLVVVLFVTLFAGAATMIVRYRRATGVERLRLRWFLWVVSLLPLGFVLCLFWRAVVGPADGVATVVLFVAEAAAAIAIGLAVTRYRLYDVDQLINRTLVYGVLSAALATLYAVIVLAFGILVGHGSSWITALATLAVAVAFHPARKWAQDLVDWRLHRARFDGVRRVLAFERAVRDGRATPEDVGVVIGEALNDPSATLLFWLPASAVYADAAGRIVLLPQDSRAHTHATRKLTRLALLVHDPSLLGRRDLLAGVLDAAGLSIEIARLRVEIKTQLTEIAASRARIVEAGYGERRRLERDLHDGAQQRLVSLGLQLRRMQRSLPAGAGILLPALDSAVDQIASAISDLRHISSGVRPARLDEGLSAALHDLARSAPMPVEISATSERLPDSIEAAAFFVACEAMTNAIKHASASRILVRAIHERGALKLSVTDDGIGGADASGSGLLGLADRVGAHGGHLVITSPPGAGTSIEVELPCAS